MTYFGGSPVGEVAKIGRLLKFLESSSVPCQGDMAHKFVR
jgi:hypothetical protein